MIWSDMFCRLAGGSADYYADGDLDAIREKAKLPKNVTLVYWDYYSKDYEYYIKMFQTKRSKELSGLQEVLGHGKDLHRIMPSV